MYDRHQTDPSGLRLRARRPADSPGWSTHNTGLCHVFLLIPRHVLTEAEYAQHRIIASGARHPYFRLGTRPPREEKAWCFTHRCQELARDWPVSDAAYRYRPVLRFDS
jgi:hypothetical protein